MKTEMKCEAVEPQLTALGLGELQVEEAAAIREHLECCASCRAAAQDIAATLDVVRAALAEAPQAAAHLDPTRRAAAMCRPQRPLRAIVRDWLDLPAEGPVELSLWPGALAKAALIFLVPLTVALGLLIPGLRMAWNAATQDHEVVVSEPVIPREMETPGFEVNILQATELAARDVLSNSAAVADASVPGASNAAFETAAEHWRGESIVRNDMPPGSKLGLGMKSDQQAVDLATVTGPIVAADLARARAATQQALAAASTSGIQQAQHEKGGSGTRLVSSMAVPPPATNIPVIAPPSTNGPPRPGGGR